MNPINLPASTIAGAQWRQVALHIQSPDLLQRF